MQRRTPLALTAALAVALMSSSGAYAAPAPSDADSTTPTFTDPGFESGSWSENTQHNHAFIVSPGADGTGHAAQIGFAYPDDETQTPEGSDLPVRGTGVDRGMVNKTVTGIEPNTQYEFSVTLKGHDIRWGIFDTEASLYYRGLARGDGGGNYDAGITTSSDGADWKTYTTTITTGPRTTQLNAFCFIGGNGPGWCDDFSIKKLGPADDPQPAPETWANPPVADNGFPVTIPAIQDFTDDGGTWDGPLTHVVVAEGDKDALSDEANLGAANLNDRLGTSIEVGYGSEDETPAGQVFLKLGDVPLPKDAPDSVQTEDSYRIDISTDRIEITASGEPGALYALSTLLQALQSSPDSLPTGVVTDYTDMKFRALQVDSGRRLYSIDWLKQQVKDLAFTHMNTLVLRVKDGQGLRVESDVFPELVDDLPDGGHWSKEDVADLVSFARRYHVRVIPEFDMPAHAGLDMKVFTDGDYMLDGAYNYARADVRERLAKVAVEMGRTFDSEYVHIGGDEFMNLDSEQAPVDWIREATGNDEANARDAFIAFANGIDEALKKDGRHMIMWNDMINDQNKVVSLNKDVTIAFWAQIYGSLSAEQLTDAGYEVIGSSSDRYHDLWPTMSTGDQTSGSDSNGEVINRPLPEYAWKNYNSPFFFSGGWGPPQMLPDANHELVRGQFFPIWDDAHGWAPEPVLTQTLMPRLRLFSQMVWNSPYPTDTFAQFDPYLRFFGHAPFFGQEQVWSVPEADLGNDNGDDTGDDGANVDGDDESSGNDEAAENANAATAGDTAAASDEADATSAGSHDEGSQADGADEAEAKGEQGASSAQASAQGSAEVDAATGGTTGTADAHEGADDAAQPEADDPLAQTGADVAAMAGLVLALIGAGSLLIRRRRRIAG